MPRDTARADSLCKHEPSLLLLATAGQQEARGVGGDARDNERIDRIAPEKQQVEIGPGKTL